MDDSEPAFLCPACQRPLTIPESGVVTVACENCRSEIDVARLSTLVGKPRFLPERCFSGATVGRFRVLSLLGAGGMGSVYRASGESGEKVALKFLSGSLAAEPEVLARFEREIAVQRRLDHPCIVRILDQGKTEGIPWFAMELVEGPTLGELLSRGRPTLEQVQALFERLLSGLAHAHDAGVVHRDLKPSNVLIGAEGAVLADFGVAHLEDGSGFAKTQLTRTATVLGTFSYMSPEQRRGKRVDARSDLFSVGVMLYEVLTGERPEGAFRPISAFRPDVARSLDALVAALLAPNPEDRPSSARDVRERLRRSLRSRRLPRTPVVAAAAALVGAGLSVWAWFPGSPDEDSRSRVAGVAVQNGPAVLVEPPTAPSAEEPRGAPAETRLPVPAAANATDNPPNPKRDASSVSVARTNREKSAPGKVGPTKAKGELVLGGSLGEGVQNQMAVQAASPAPPSSARNRTELAVKKGK